MRSSQKTALTMCEGVRVLESESNHDQLFNQGGNDQLQQQAKPADQPLFHLLSPFETPADA